MLKSQPLVVAFSAMADVIIMMLRSLLTALRCQAGMQAEIIALRHQLIVLQRTQTKQRLKLRNADRCLWVWLSRLWSGWRSALTIIRPETVVGWHRQRFGWYWTWKIRRGRTGPGVPKTRDLIRTMSQMNALWDAPRIHSELLKLGIKISRATVAKYMVRHPKPPSQTWRTFLTNHVSQLASVDFFTVPTLWFDILFVCIVLRHDRRRVGHRGFNVTAHPTAEWAAQQMLEAFPFDSAPKYLLRDRDQIYGYEFRKQLEVMNIEEVLSAPRCPWQRAYVERVIGSIRRECLDQVIILDEESLRRTLVSYFSYYHRSRLHLSLDKDLSDSRSMQTVGNVVAFREVGGLHHRYERRTA
jgi:putative transposase